MSNKCWSGTGKEGKTKEVVKDREVKKSCMWRVVYKGLKRRAHWRAHTAQNTHFFFVHRQRQLRRTRFLPTLGQNDRGGTWQQCERHAAMRQQRSDQIRNKLMRWQSVVQGNYQIFCWYYIICMLLLLCVAVWRSFHLRWPWTTAMGLFKCAPYFYRKAIHTLQFTTPPNAIIATPPSVRSLRLEQKTPDKTPDNKTTMNMQTTSTSITCVNKPSSGHNQSDMNQALQCFFQLWIKAIFTELRCKPGLSYLQWPDVHEWERKGTCLRS